MPEALLTLVHRMGCKATRDTPVTSVRRAMDTKAARYTFPAPIPLMGLPSMAILATARWRTGRLEAGTLSSLLAEFRPRESTFNALGRLLSEERMPLKNRLPL